MGAIPTRAPLESAQRASLGRPGTEDQVAQIQITGLGGDARDIPGETLDALAARLEGTLIFPDGEGFAEALLIWNGMIKKQPALVVRPSSTKDVVQTVDFVRDNELVLSIKGGGHNIAGLALSDGLSLIHI